jgi:hypothetical protein
MAAEFEDRPLRRRGVQEPVQPRVAQVLQIA